MSGTTANAGNNDVVAEQSGEATTETTQTAEKPAFTPITSQEELDKIVSARVQRERQKYADYNDLKAKADRLDETEAKLAEATGKLSAFEKAKELEGWKKQVSEETGVPASVLRGETLEDLQTHAKELAEAYPKPRSMPVVPGAGNEPAAGGSSEMQEFTRSIFGK